MQNAGTSEIVSAFLPLVLLFVFFYFFLVRPQNKKNKEVQEMRDNVKEGDKIMTIGGIIGTVLEVNKDSVIIDSSGSRLEFNKNAISTVGDKEDDDLVKDKEDIDS